MTITLDSTLREKVKRLEAKLDDQWAWFEANPGHPEDDHRTDIFLRTLQKYMSAADESIKERKDGAPCP